MRPDHDTSHHHQPALHHTAAADGAHADAAEPQESTQAKQPRGIRAILKSLGPGIIAGASDDDPATIGTCANLGASLGLATLWTMLFTLPLMAAMQYMTAKISLVTGRGLSGVIRTHYSRKLLYPVVVLLVLANAINAGADLGAMAAALNLLIPIPIQALIIPLASLIVILQFWANYRIIERTFRWLTLSLFAFIGAAILSKPNALEVLQATFIPTFRFDHQFLQAMVAIAGTMFSPYLYSWQSSQEVEEKIDSGLVELAERQGASDAELRATAWDVNLGMFMANVVAYFVILAAASTLFVSGHHDVNTAADMARALRPLAGEASSVFLALGLIGTGLLSVPVLTTSAAYAVAETFRWRRGLSEKPSHATHFYGVIVLASLIAMEINYLGISPVDALFWTSVMYGFLAPPLLLLIVLISSNRKVMGDRANGLGIKVIGWIAVVLSAAAAIAMLVA